MKKHFWLFIWVLGVSLHASSESHISVPDPLTWSTKELSAYVGQTVVFDAPIVVCANSSSSSLIVGTRLVFAPTNQGSPATAAYNETVSRNATATMTLSGVTGYHRCGERIIGLKAYVNSTTSLSWVGGTWRGNSRADLEAGLPELGEYDLLVCAMNLENYFVKNLGKDYLGADTYAEHQQQRTKINKALTKINADLYGLVELEDGHSALDEIVADLNASLPGRNYTYIPMTRSESAAQMADVVYDANILEPVGAMQVNDAKLSNRKKMICMRERATGEKFIYSINHFKAKSGSGIGADAAGIQGAFNGTRVEEAQSVLDRYKTYSRSGIKEKDLLVMGDLNAYAKEDPIMVFLKAGMTDLHRAYHADTSYSYRTRNAVQVGYLDHALCNETMVQQITGMAAYHINSDESDRYSYSGGSDQTMFRSSDHDPILVGLRLDSTLITHDELYINTGDLMRGASDVMTIHNGLVEGQKSYYAIYTVQGLLLRREQITDSTQDAVLPEAPGVYIVYIYYNGAVKQFKIVVR